MTLTGRRALALAAVALGLAIGACGRKGPPVAPEQRLPMAVIDLEGTLRDGVVELVWSAPRRRVDNTRIVEPATTRLFRTEDSGQGEPRPAMLVDDRIVGYKEIVTFRAGDPAAPTAERGRFTYVDRNLTLGHRYTYVVTATDAQGRTSAPSRRLTLAIVAVPEAPRDVRAVPGEREVQLSWQPPERFTDGGPVESPLIYEVLRSTTADGPLGVVARTAPGVTTLVDPRLENDRAYYYAIRSVRQEGAVMAQGLTSARVSATPTDITPPRPATSLVAIPSERAVRLSWTPSPDADVVGYVVYRATATGAFERIGSVRAPATTFTDRDVPAGPYRYAVTAQDSSVRANESVYSNEVSVTVP
jgi:fibronectin type 3 domain-containing protein